MIDTISEVESGLELFKQFTFTDNMPEEEKLEIIDSAISLGRDYAEQIAEEFGNQKPRELLKHFGVQVKDEEAKQDANASFVKFAEYYAKSGIILLNRQAIKKIDSKLRSELAEDIVLGHELFHYFEANRWGFTSERYIRSVKLFGVVPVKRKILSAAEIAANSFTKKYLNLDFNPKMIEKIYFE